MARYYFDTRDDDEVLTDEIGWDCADFDEVKVQAAKSLALIALDVLPGSVRRRLGIDVRNEDGEQVLTTDLTFEARVLVEA